MESTNKQTGNQAAFPCAVMCCGCRRFLTTGGDIKMPEPGGGILSLADALQVLTFPNGDEADLAAARAGWQVADAEGSNHRCPECLAPPPTRADIARTAAARGAHVPVADLWARTREVRRFAGIEEVGDEDAEGGQVFERARR